MPAKGVFSNRHARGSGGDKTRGMKGRKSVTRCLSADLPPSPLPQLAMVELKRVFKKAYWSLAAGGLLYVLFVCAMTYPEVQRLYVQSFQRGLVVG